MLIGAAAAAPPTPAAAPPPRSITPSGEHAHVTTGLFTCTTFVLVLPSFRFTFTLRALPPAFVAEISRSALPVGVFSALGAVFLVGYVWRTLPYYNIRTDLGTSVAKLGGDWHVRLCWWRSGV